MKYVIGLDLGTSSVKALLLDETGVIVDQKNASYQPDFGDKGHVEQVCSVWWDNAKKVIKDIIAANPLSKGNIAAVSFSGQMHSSVFLDENGEVIRPAILWNDTRTTKQTKEIYEKTGGEKHTLSYVYNRALEGFTLPKILWLRENEPENYAKVRKVIMPKDYINYKLTGVIKTDVSDAAGTLLFDVKGKKWSEEMASAVGISTDILPEAIESTGLVGYPLKEIAEELGLSADTKIIAGGADNSCAAIGNGVVNEGQAIVSVGTSGTVVAFLSGINSEVTGDVHLFNYSYPGSCYAMGCMLSAGECRNWLQKNVLQGMSFEEMDELAAKTPAGSNGLVFLPYLFGERCPHSDANARGMFFGLNANTAEGEFSRSVMEGVAFGFKGMFDLVSDFTDINEIYITGGGARSKLFGQIIADVLNRPLKILNIEQGPAFGAALIAAVGSGMFVDFASAKDKTLKVARTIEPNTDDNKVYEKYYKIYSALYDANKALFAKLAEI